MHASLLAQPSRQEILAVQRARFGHRRLRPGQEEILQDLLVVPESDSPFAVGVGVRRQSWGDGIIERVTGDSITVLFDAVGFKMLDLAQVLERGVLEPVADRVGGG
jgi:hypothetical protein